MISKQVRTTVSLPADLVEKADALVRAGYARSRAELLSEALREEVRRLEREQVDARIREMAWDEEALSENRRVHAEFEHADRETWSTIDR